MCHFTMTPEEVNSSAVRFQLDNFKWWRIFHLEQWLIGCRVSSARTASVIIYHRWRKEVDNDQNVIFDVWRKEQPYLVSYRQSKCRLSEWVPMTSHLRPLLLNFPQFKLRVICFQRDEQYAGAYRETISIHYSHWNARPTLLSRPPSTPPWEHRITGKMCVSCCTSLKFIHTCITYPKIRRNPVDWCHAELVHDTTPPWIE